MLPSKSNSEYLALFVFIAIPLIFGMGQEINGVLGPHDNSYFIARALHFDLNGDYHAGIKEVLYPLYIRLSWVFGLGLRNFEVICYGISLFCLWLQVIALTNSRFIAWGSVLPMTCFCYQHPQFNGSTYDALQLILLPLSLASSIYLYCSKASWRSVFGAGIVVGLHGLTRTEGFVFILPPAVALIFVWVQSSKGIKISIKKIFLKFLLILTILFLSLQLASYINWATCGFWAPTIMESSSFHQCLSKLMSIDPQATHKIRYATITKVSLQKAYQVSPAFCRSKPFFDMNINGCGWSKNGGIYHPADGSIGAGFIQWALLDAGAFVARGNSREMLKYFDQVSYELENGFKQGTIKKRWILSIALGPDFSFFEPEFWSGLGKVGQMFLNLSNPTLPQIAQEGDIPERTQMYNEVAFRRTSLLDTQSVLTGWVVNKNQGIPKTITLDWEAIRTGGSLKVKERPDVALKIFNLGKENILHPNCGIEIKAFAYGHLLVSNGSDTQVIPLGDVMNMKSGSNYKKGNLLLHAENIKKYSDPKISPVIFLITKIVYEIARIVIFFSLFIFLLVLIFKRPLFKISLDVTPIYLVFSLVASIALPRLIYLAAYTANIFTGAEIRYVASGVFPVWFFGFFGVSFFIYHLLKRITNTFTHVPHKV